MTPSLRLATSYIKSTTAFLAAGLAEGASKARTRREKLLQLLSPSPPKASRRCASACDFPAPPPHSTSSSQAPGPNDSFSLRQRGRGRSSPPPTTPPRRALAPPSLPPPATSFPSRRGLPAGHWLSAPPVPQPLSPRPPLRESGVNRSVPSALTPSCFSKGKLAPGSQPSVQLCSSQSATNLEAGGNQTKKYILKFSCTSSLAPRTRSKRRKDTVFAETQKITGAFGLQWLRLPGLWHRLERRIPTASCPNYLAILIYSQLLYFLGAYLFSMGNLLQAACCLHSVIMALPGSCHVLQQRMDHSTWPSAVTRERCSISDVGICCRASDRISAEQSPLCMPV
ncbi:uncharacterized protein LOC114012563 [Falco peregrinus]|uniref:uncharacterized protein LOC114012563 n=1 Tax=Falco peregrinus TaxID=8954 RepID=UPI0024790C58|nr:uncharacterized protein LOC114012563 [Falco peregrinus]